MSLPEAAVTGWRRVDRDGIALFSRFGYVGDEVHTWVAGRKEGRWWGRHGVVTARRPRSEFAEYLANCEISSAMDEVGAFFARDDELTINPDLEGQEWIRELIEADGGLQREQSL